MNNLIKKIAAFFDEYARRFQEALDGTQPDVQGTASSFADTFIEASPAGIRCAANNSEFLEAIPKGYDFYKKIGTKRMEIETREITPLDDIHALVKIHCLSSYIRKDGSNIQIGFDVFYLVQAQGEMARIFCYITGDEQKKLAAYGLLS